MDTANTTAAAPVTVPQILHILLLSAGAEMLRIDTGRLSTSVIDHKSRSNWAVRSFVGEAVR